ncbi:DUF1998 domain-containing protein [Shewanella sp. DC2-4]|uniref:DUF1998 domain-containing protein n=1 Tax=Shewanella sp. DC2-4 TaxID=2739431 RepID=UPI0015679B38|nr:DUF1998 domain-containing protein [Shewanella sp. DC2-4]NRD30668.1 DUF1998 domain-containing protein [Shewanella sp. DC2-4]
MADSKHAYRSSQLITPFGPGAIIELGDESLVLADPSYWPKRLEEVKLERLAREAGVWALKKPPVIKDKREEPGPYNALMTVRFPKWMFCPRCKKMELWKPETGKKNAEGIPVCPNRACKQKVLAPMRFVAACQHGHLQDVPWVYWAHKKSKQNTCEHPELYFLSNPEKGSGLDALYVECKNPECGSQNSLTEIMSQHALMGVKCDDKQPWESKKLSDRECPEPLNVLQRGASNLYYPIIRSALDIPHSGRSVGNSIYAKLKESNEFESLIRALDGGKERLIQAYAAEIGEEFDLTIEQVINAVKGKGREERTFKIPKDEDLRVAEWELFSSESIETKETETFKAKVAKWADNHTFGFENVFRRVVLLEKLREVRAFCGFERVIPGNTSVSPKTATITHSWLPATEVYGEGIFIEVNSNVLSAWENHMAPELKKRIATLQKNHASLSSTYLPEPNVKFLILHTLAHILIRQLSFESGYSSGSLRERIYAADGQAGLLIYTADGDSEGSLGGLVQQGEANRLFPALLAALEAAHWCSNDPVCSEKQDTGIMGLNQAACHSCSIISETSCENNNLLLDRKILIGNDEYEGFFTDIVTAAQEALS